MNQDGTSAIGKNRVYPDMRYEDAATATTKTTIMKR
jgi:hypothetical protein